MHVDVTVVLHHLWPLAGVQPVLSLSCWHCTTGCIALALASICQHICERSTQPTISKSLTFAKDIAWSIFSRRREHTSFSCQISVYQHELIPFSSVILVFKCWKFPVNALWGTKFPPSFLLLFFGFLLWFPPQNKCTYLKSFSTKHEIFRIICNIT